MASLAHNELKQMINHINCKYRNWYSFKSILYSAHKELLIEAIEAGHLKATTSQGLRMVLFLHTNNAAFNINFTRQLDSRPYKVAIVWMSQENIK